MKVKLSEFPHQPGTLPCCRECKGKAKKDCTPDPMNCTDFYIQNKAFIEMKQAEAKLLVGSDEETRRNAGALAGIYGPEE